MFVAFDELIASEPCGERRWRLIRRACLSLHFVPELGRPSALQDVEFRGKNIKKGDKVVMWHVSGNRDDEVTENPDAYVIDRARLATTCRSVTVSIGASAIDWRSYPRANDCSEG